MNVIAAAFCPHPPLLLPALSAGEPVAVRAPAIAAVRWLCSQSLQRMVLLGAAEQAEIFDPGAAGSFAGYGVDCSVRLPGASARTDQVLPLSLAVGAWLLEQADCRAPVIGVTCDPLGNLPLWNGRDSGEPGAMGLLVMGDGSARRTEKAPGWLDERAKGYDNQVSAALAAGDPAMLELAGDLSLGAGLLAAGAPAWLASSRLLAGRRWSAGVSYDDAPYGVGYLVATWSSRDPG